MFIYSYLVESLLSPPEILTYTFLPKTASIAGSINVRIFYNNIGLQTPALML
jgi:hypothetical protein